MAQERKENEELGLQRQIQHLVDGLFHTICVPILQHKPGL